MMENIRNRDKKSVENVMDEFRAGISRVLIATDLWGRGLDVQQVSLVICYDITPNKELYIHRIGRSGRFGRKGLAINFMKKDDCHMIYELEKHYHIKHILFLGKIS